MENKVLVKVMLPDIDITYDIFIPVNEYVWKVKKLLLKAISDLSSISINIDLNYVVINRDNGRIYNDNEIIINTDIRNATELLLVVL